VTWTLGTTAQTQTLSVAANGATVRVAVQAVPSEAVALSTVSGAGQSGAVGDPLPEPIVVEAQDTYANAVPGTTLDIEVSSGGGQTDAAQVVTDAQGQVSVTWSLGPELGSQSVQVRLDTVAQVDIPADARPGPAASIETLSGDGQTGTVASALSLPVQVHVQDRFGNATSATQVDFSATSGGGTVASSSVRPDSGGVAGTAWSLGTSAGTQTIEARVPGAPAIVFTATAVPGAPDRLVLISGDDQTGPATLALATPLTVEVRDTFDNFVSGTAIAFGVIEGGGGLTSSSSTTDTQGRASTTWTLGPGLGTNRVSATVVGFSGSGPGSVEFTAIATSLPPAQVVVNSGDGQSTEVGTAVTSALSARVFDAVGNPVPGVAVAFSVSSGGGSLSGDTPTTDSTGTATLGSWTVGTTAGAQSVLATVVGLPPATFTATALPGAPFAFTIASGDAQNALVGGSVPIRPRVRVADSFGNGVAGVQVDFAVTGGGGAVTGGTPSTGGAGEAAVGNWTMGANPGVNTLQASAAGLSPLTFTATATLPAPGFSMEVQFSGTPSASQRAVVRAAAARWEQVITGDLPDVNTNLNANACGVSHPAYNGTVDDLVVFVEIVSIDGPGGTLGSAGPCFLRSGSSLPVFGSVRLDVDDVAQMESNGTFDDVALHELGHVLGMGTLWSSARLLQGRGSPDPYFSGTHAITEYQAMGGAHPNPVPVENTGGSGTRDAHWRESLLTTELMTGWISTGANPLSRLTVGGLDDLGYPVSYGGADPFTGASEPIFGVPITFQLQESGPLVPIRFMDVNGGVVPR